MADWVTSSGLSFLGLACGIHRRLAPGGIALLACHCLGALWPLHVVPICE